jgi:hypothetical protein
METVLLTSILNDPEHLAGSSSEITVPDPDPVQMSNFFLSNATETDLKINVD